MDCKHCGNTIPSKRVEMGYRECVNCSTTQRWSANPVIFHKTGNTTEIIKDPELAEDLAFASARKGFGVLNGMTANRKRRTINAAPTPTKKIKPAVTSYSVVISTQKITYYFQEVGQEMMDIFEKQGYTSALAHVQKSLQDKRINNKHASQLSQILNTFNHD